MPKLLRRVAMGLALPMVIGAPVLLAAPAQAAAPAINVTTTPGSAQYGQKVLATTAVFDSVTEQPVASGFVTFQISRPGYEGGSFVDVPVDATGHATTPSSLVMADGRPLEPTGGVSDVWTISAYYYSMPGSMGSPDALDSVTLNVGKAPGSVAVQPSATTLVADVNGAPPSASLPTSQRATGPVTFRVDGAVVGTANAVAGQATITYTVPAGSHSVTAAYDGDTRYTAGTSDAATRKDPLLEGRVLSIYPQKNGWYRAPVDVWVKCRPQGSELVQECPDIITLKKSGADQSVTVKVTALDGGSASITVGDIDIDRDKPKISVDGTSCTATDKLSGVQGRCKVKLLGDGRYEATAKDKAGNVKVKRGKLG